MDKKALSRFSKLVILMQTGLVVGLLAFVYFFAPHIDSPGNGEVVEGGIVDFNFRNANVIVIDDNIDFSSPVVINLSDYNTSRFRFDPGVYYWKAEGLVESRSNKFTVPSQVGLELDYDNSTLVNVGNVPIRVSAENQSGISGLAIVDVQVEYPVEIENGTVYRGEQYEVVG